MPPAAKGHQTLSAYISSRFDEFSRSQKDVAQYVVDHLDEVAFHTAEELARRDQHRAVEAGGEHLHSPDEARPTAGRPGTRAWPGTRTRA